MLHLISNSLFAQLFLATQVSLCLFTLSGDPHQSMHMGKEFDLFRLILTIIFAYPLNHSHFVRLNLTRGIFIFGLRRLFRFVLDYQKDFCITGYYRSLCLPCISVPTRPLTLYIYMLVSCLKQDLIFCMHVASYFALRGCLHVRMHYPNRRICRDIQYFDDSGIYKASCAYRA